MADAPTGAVLVLPTFGLAAFVLLVAVTELLLVFVEGGDAGTLVFADDGLVTTFAVGRFAACVTDLRAVEGTAFFAGFAGAAGLRAGVAFAAGFFAATGRFGFAAGLAALAGAFFATLLAALAFVFAAGFAFAAGLAFERCFGFVFAISELTL
ncbi:hypothetical protein [Dokdonella sp.]|uniref:hypothetical protein n=1 Tax=Dokdonella sp. TaxID=2291710 RepID=UPI0025C51053|nr:hypothetical protein [Dokdonella sp.]